MITLDPLSLDITGEDQQGLTGGDYDFASSPVIFHDQNNRLLVGASHKDNHFYAYELENVTKGAIWSKPAVFAIGMLAAYDPNVGQGGTLFLTGRDGVLYAVDPATGTEVWPPIKVGKLHGNLAVANGLIFADAGGAGLSVYDGHDGRLLRTLMPEHAADGYSGVAIAHGFIYWVSGGYLNAWSLP
jgi:outer membrane protein assembly factor BamB